MKLKDLGEFGFIERIKVDALVRTYEGLIGIGDDCAIFKISNGMSALLTTDMMVERVHFLREHMTPYQIGYKAMTSNLSDIASAGGLPREAFISIAVPENIEVNDLDELYRGMKDLGRDFDVNITGGDTTGSFQDLVLNIAIVGEVEPELALYRNGARPGDIICVTGYLGDSAAGLDVILNHNDLKSEYLGLIKQHFQPYPHVRQGRLAAKSRLAHAMMDISDGLAADIKHVCAASKLGAELYEDKIPLSDEFKKYRSELKPDYLETAISVGEDYCLMLTIAEDDFPKLKREFEKEGFDLFDVGRMTEEDKIVLIKSDGGREELEYSGWDHFKE